MPLLQYRRRVIAAEDGQTYLLARRRPLPYPLPPPPPPVPTAVLTGFEVYGSFLTVGSTYSTVVTATRTADGRRFPTVAVGSTPTVVTATVTATGAVAGASVVTGSIITAVTADRTATGQKFPLTAGSVVTPVSVTTAAAGASSLSQAVRAYTSATPPTVAEADPVPVSLGLEFYVTANSTVTQIHFWQPTTGADASTRSVAIYTATGVLVSPAETLTVSGVGWQTKTLATPVPVAANTRYRATVYHPGGQYPATPSYYTTGGGGSVLTNGVLVVPNNAASTSPGQGTYQYATGISFPNSMYSSTSYWCDVSVLPVPVVLGASTPCVVTANRTANGAVSGNSPYDLAVLADSPVAYWKLADAGSTVADSVGTHTGTYINAPAATTLPNGDAVKVFNGSTQYAEIPDANDLSIPLTGVITLEAWMRPDTLEFPHDEDTGYVQWMGKEVYGGNSEYACRIYSYTNTESRPNRISGYAFNLAGGIGVGSYFQDVVTPGQWIHFALVVNTVNTSGGYPMGYTKVFKNGVLRDQDSLAGVSIAPGNGTAPFRVAVTALDSYFLGGIGKVALYDHELTAARLLAHYNAG